MSEFALENEGTDTGRWGTGTLIGELLDIRE